MFCAHCGKEIRDDAVFCPACGERTAPGTPLSAGVQQAAPSFAGVEQHAAKKGSKKGVVIAVIALVLVALALIAAIVVFRLFGSSSDSSIAKAKKGDIITFGAYEQDGNESNGKEPIEWEVLDVQDDRVLVVSRYVLDCVPYHENRDQEVTWETCFLRNWLNDEFFNIAFSQKEQQRIVESRLTNPGNAYHGTPGGNDTEDHVFLLSMEELRRFYEFNSWYDFFQTGFCEALIIDATAFAIKNDAYVYRLVDESYRSSKGDYTFGECLEMSLGETYLDTTQFGGLYKENYSPEIVGRVGTLWWLRTPGTNSYSAIGVSTAGLAGWHSYDVGSTNLGVRPAMWISK